MAVLWALLGSCGGPGNQPPPGGDRPSSFQLIDEAVARGELDQETGLVYKVYSVFADKRLPGKYLGDDRRRDGTWLMARVTQTFGQLSPQAQATLKPFLLTPPEPGSWFELQESTGQSLKAQTTEWGTVGTKNGKVKIWYQKRYPADGARAQKIADAIDNTIWPLLTEAIPVGLGLKEPLPDCGATCSEGGGDERLDIYLVDVNRSVTHFYCCQGSWAYILLERTATFADVAHELMHAIQAAYPFASLEEYRWLLEATAAWAEQYVYPKSNQDPDYPATDEEHGVAPKFLLIPESPLETVNDDHEYGAYLLFFYLQYGLSRPEIVRSVWENATKADSLEVVDAAIPGGFRERWPEFTLYNWNQEPVTHYRRWDGLGKGANIVTGFQIGLAGEDLLPADVHHLSAYYYTARITSESVRTFIVENPLAAGGEPTARLWGIVKIGGQWRPPEDWTALERKKFCRDKPEEHVEELVLIISNSKWQDRHHRLGAGEVKLVAKEGGCITKWTGSASGFIALEDGFIRVSAQGVRWELLPPGDVYHQSFIPVEGTVTFEYDPEGPCTATVNPSSQAITKENTEGLLTVDYRTYPPTYGGFGGSGWMATYTFVCPDGTGTGTFPLGGEWFSGQGAVSADGTTIAGTHTKSGWTFTYSFTQQK